MHIKLTNAQPAAILRIVDYLLDEQALRASAEKKGLSTLSEMAQRFGLHRNTLRAYVSGEKTVFSDVVTRLAAALDVDPLNLIKRRELEGGLDREFRALLMAAKEASDAHDGLAFALIGSRAAGTAAEFSDWDMAVTGGRATPVDADLYLELRSKFDDVSEDFSRSVDLVNLDQAPVWFLREIDYNPSFVAGSRESFNYFLGLLDGIGRKG